MERSARAAGGGKKREQNLTKLLPSLKDSEFGGAGLSLLRVMTPGGWLAVRLGSH